MTTYLLHPEPTHTNTPNAWAVWTQTTTTNHDGEDTIHDECIAHGIPLTEALDQIQLHHEHQ